MKKSIAFILALVMCLGMFAGCGETSTPPAENPADPPAAAPAPDDTITDTGSMTVEIETDENTVYAKELTFIQDNTKTAILDPQNSASATSSSQCVFLLIFDRLITFEDGEYKPELATSWETEDQQHFTFHLRDDVKFHNGEPFTADDVAFTIDRAKTEGLGSNAGTKWSAVDTYEIVDDYTIKLNLVTVNVDFLKELSTSYMGILNREACEADPEKGTWITTGPFKVSEFASNEYGVYVRNDDYWGEAPITEKITIKFIAEETSRLIALQNNEADVVAGINPIEFPALEADDKYEAYPYTVHNCVYLAFNLGDELMSDLNFRKAVASAIYRPDIILAARNGYASEPESGSFWGWRTESKNLDVEVMPYDLEAAKAYLAESSYNGEVVEICCAIPDITIGAQVIAEQLKAIGINVEMYQTDTTGLSAYTTWGSNQGQIIVYTGGWTSMASSSKSWYYPGSNYNRAAYNNADVVALFDKAPGVLDEAERDAIYQEIQEIATAELPFLPIWYNRHLVFTQNGVAGIVFNSDSAHDYTYAYRVIE